MFGFTPDPLGIDNVRSVHGRSGVDQIIVPAGHRVLLMDADDAVFYVKETDMRGLSVVQAYTFTEQMADPAPEYVTISMLDNGVVVATQTVTATAGGAISVPITAAVRPCCKPSRINFSVNVVGTAGEVQVVAMS